MKTLAAIPFHLTAYGLLLAAGVLPHLSLRLPFWMILVAAIPLSLISLLILAGVAREHFQLCETSPRSAHITAFFLFLLAASSGLVFLLA
jgi:hypothetical protein